MRGTYLFGILGLLAACTSAPPNDLDRFSGNPIKVSEIVANPAPVPVASQRAPAPATSQPAAPATPEITTSEIVDQEEQRLAAAESQNVSELIAQDVASAPATQTAVTPQSTGISNSQDFGAVTARVSRNADAEAIKAVAAQRVEIQPTALPQRENAANITAYALAQRHPVGQKMFSRGVGSRLAKNKGCKGFRSDNEAQLAFLQSGGPTKDKLRVDADGDGYACGWDPAPTRRLIQDQ